MSSVDEQRSCGSCYCWKLKVEIESGSKYRHEDAGRSEQEAKQKVRHIQRVPYFFVWQTAFRGSQRRQQSQTDQMGVSISISSYLSVQQTTTRCSRSKTRENRRYGTLRPYLGHFTILLYLFGRTFYSVFCQLMQPQPTTPEGEIYIQRQQQVSKEV